MSGDIEQPAVVGLAMHFQQQAAQLLQQAHTHGFVIDESAGLAVGGETSAQHDLAFVRHRLLFQECPGRVVREGIEDRRGGALRRARTHAGAATRAHGEAKRIEQNRFARTGFTGEHIQPRREFQRGLFDQDDVAHCQRGKHFALI